MTRLLHAADLHMGRLTHGRPGPDGIPTSVASVARCWSAAVDIALEREVDGVIVAGDIFDTRNPNATALMLFQEGLWRLQAHDVPVLMIAGNHERQWPECVLSLFCDEANGYRVSTEPNVIEWCGLKVGTLPSIGRRNLAASGVAQKARAVDAAIGEALERILAWYAAEGCDVVVGHWSVAGSVLGESETDISIIDEPMIQPEWLEPFAYSAFGHIHKRQRLPGGSAGEYSGSIDRMTFSEEHDRKGVCVVDIDPGHLGVEYVDTPARRFVTIDTGFHVGDLDVDGAIVRLIGQRDTGYDIDKLIGWMNNAGADLVLDQTTTAREVQVRDAGMVEAISPLAAVDRWLDGQEVDEGIRPDVRERAKELLA